MCLLRWGQRGRSASRRSAVAPGWKTRSAATASTTQSTRALRPTWTSDRWEDRHRRHLQLRGQFGGPKRGAAIRWVRHEISINVSIGAARAAESHSPNVSASSKNVPSQSSRGTRSSPGERGKGRGRTGLRIAPTPCHFFIATMFGAARAKTFLSRQALVRSNEAAVMPSAISTSSPSSRPQAARRGIPSSRRPGRCRARLRGSGRAATSFPVQQAGIRFRQSAFRGT